VDRLLDFYPEAAHGRPEQPLRLGLALGVMGAAIVLGAIVGLTLGPYSPGEPESEGAEFLGGFNGWGAVGVMVGTLFLGWALSGRWLLRPLGDTLRRHRVGLHTWTSMAALGLALVHTVGLVARSDTRAWISGTASLALLLALFVTGWWRTACVRLWGLKTWRWVHWELAVGAILLGLEHWLIIEHGKELALAAAGA
jgi:hypothetical protein